MRFVSLILFLSFFIVWHKSLSDRLKFSINEGWKFKKNETHFSGNYEYKDDSWEDISLPHTWNTSDLEDDDYKYFQGVSWYRKKLKIDQQIYGKKVFLNFEGVNQTAKIYLNGILAGTHVGGYSAFIVDITQLIDFKKQHQLLALEVNNATNENIPPSETGLFPLFGGIYRDVFVICTDNTHLIDTAIGTSSIFLQTPNVNESNARVKIYGKIFNESDIIQTISIEHSIFNKNGLVIAKKERVLKLRPKSFLVFEDNEININRPDLWSPDNPQLYSLLTIIKNIKTKTIYDQSYISFGFRWYSFDAQKGFSLNGKPLMLAGANRHQDYKNLGNALPDELHYQDIKLLKEMGVNFVRLAHYPQDPSVLEACDKLGLIVWEEIPLVVNISLTHGYWDNAHKMLKEMIFQHQNHPSIVMWGYMNEILTKVGTGQMKKDSAIYSRETVRLAKSLDSLTRKLDPSRITVMAIEYNPVYNDSKIADIPMVVGWNLYMGWYYETFENFGKFMDQEHKKYPNRPILISEFGAASDARIHSFKPQVIDHSIEWQQLFTESHLKQIYDRPYIAGYAMWNFVDFHHITGWATPQVNTKGILDMSRNKKDVYYLFQSKLQQNPIIKIASSDFKNRTGIASKEGSFCIQPIKIYTNCDTVELFCNGKSIGVKKVENNTVVFDGIFIDGANNIKAVGLKKNNKAEDHINIEFKLQPSNFNSPNFSSIAVNVGSNCYFIDKNSKMVWNPDQAYEPGKFGYIGGKPIYRNNDKWIGWDGDLFDTENDVLYHTGLENINAYKFDVGNGLYELELLFAEQSWDKQPRIFDVVVNGKTILPNFEIAAEVGPWRPLHKKIQVITTEEKGVEIKLNPVKGNTVLNGIILNKVN